VSLPPSEPRLFRINLNVPDIEAAAAFYHRLLGIPGTRVSKNRHYFTCGPTILACVEPPVGAGESATPNAELFFAVADLDAVYERAKQSGCRQLDDRVELQHWGERAFFAEDPFGNPLAFVDEKTLFTADRRPAR
jgi:predicted enzyme related to lactoylglutathione lyase